MPHRPFHLPTRRRFLPLVALLGAGVVTGGCHLVPDGRCLGSTRGVALTGGLTDAAGRPTGTFYLMLLEQRGDGGPLRNEQSLQYDATRPGGGPALAPQDVRIRLHVGEPAGPGAPVYVTLPAPTAPGRAGETRLAYAVVVAPSGQPLFAGAPGFEQFAGALRRGPVYVDIRVAGDSSAAVGARLQVDPAGPRANWTRNGGNCS